METAAPGGGCGRLAEGHPAFGRSRMPYAPSSHNRLGKPPADPGGSRTGFPQFPQPPTTTTSIVRTTEISCKRQPPQV